MSTGVTLTFEEVEAWASAEFPQVYKIFQEAVDNIMTPTKYPSLYNPNGYGTTSGPMPEFRDWIVPLKNQREKLGMENHACLCIGLFNTEKKGNNTQPDKLVIYSVSHGHQMRFGRLGGQDNSVERLPAKNVLSDGRPSLFPLWRGISQHISPQQDVLSLFETTSLWIHVQRMMVPMFTGSYASKTTFRAACEAYAASVKPKRQPFRPFPGRAIPTITPAASASEPEPLVASSSKSSQPSSSLGKRRMSNDPEEHPAQRVKREDWETRAKSAEVEMGALRENITDMEGEVEALNAELDTLNAELEAVNAELEALKERMTLAVRLLNTDSED